jgi:hypothetical protein
MDNNNNKTVELKSQHNPKEPNNINTKEIVTKWLKHSSDYIREDKMDVHTSHTPMGRHAKPHTYRWKYKYICDFAPKSTKNAAIAPNLMERVARLRHYTYTIPVKRL